MIVNRVAAGTLTASRGRPSTVRASPAAGWRVAIRQPGPHTPWPHFDGAGRAKPLSLGSFRLYKKYASFIILYIFITSIRKEGGAEWRQTQERAARGGGPRPPPPPPAPGSPGGVSIRGLGGPLCNTGGALSRGFYKAKYYRILGVLKQGPAVGLAKAGLP